MLRAPEPRPATSARPGARAASEPPWRSRRPWFVLGALAALSIGVSLLAFGPLVRARVALEAERRKLDVDVGGVRPGFFAITLTDVRVRPQGVSGIEAVLDSVRIDLGATLTPDQVRARGGRIRVEGEPEDVARRLRELRGGGSDPARAAGGTSRLGLRAEELSLAWPLPSGGELAGARITVARDPDGLRITCASCSARRERLSVEAIGAEVELTAAGALRHLSAGSLSVAQAPLSPSAAPPAPTASPPVEPIPPPLPTVVAHGRRGKSKKESAKAAALTAPPPSGPVLPLPDLHALRSRIATAVAALAPRISDQASVEIGGLSARLDVGGEPIAFGPGKLTLERRTDRLHLLFASAGAADGAPAGTTPLSIDAEVPIGAGELSARLAGGPVSLAMLGVEEGTKGLTDVAHGTVSGKGLLVLSEAADALTFDGSLALRGIALTQPRIAQGTLRGIDFSVAGKGVLDDRGKVRVDDAQIDMGALHLRTHGTLEESADHFAVALAVELAPAACQALVESAPQGLLPLVRSARMTGTFAVNLNLAFDTRTIDKLALDYRIGDDCKMVEVSRELSRERFESAFTYRTYKPDGKTGETTTGPGTDTWTPLDDISPFMIAAVLTTEDGAFYRHHGFNHAAIRSSVQANLKARRFVRGASTISMQLAKNLFLARDKALSRKIEEVILTDYLEQIYRKEDIMELYLNVVEFGPDVYGITQAAEYYFARKPEELDVAESFFLATLLPSPIRYGKLRERGEVTEGWMRHLHTLMEIAERNGKLSRAELEDGLKQPVVFVRPGEPRPPPRRPVTAAHRTQEEDDAAWQPLE